MTIYHKSYLKHTGVSVIYCHVAHLCQGFDWVSNAAYVANKKPYKAYIGDG